MKKLVFIVVILFLSGCYLNGMVTELKPISNIVNSSLNKDTYIHLSIYCKYSNHPVELKFWYATYDYKNFSNGKYNNGEFKINADDIMIVQDENITTSSTNTTITSNYRVIPGYPSLKQINKSVQNLEMPVSCISLYEKNSSILIKKIYKNDKIILENVKFQITDLKRTSLRDFLLPETKGFELWLE